jgi:hypothetical protein
LLRWVAAGIFAFAFLSSGVLGLYLSRPESGLGRNVLDVIEYPIQQDEGLRYNTHRALGKIFSLCPCTAGLSADQYRRAWFHRPDDHVETPAP